MTASRPTPRHHSLRPPATADDGAVEYLQLGAGLLAGLSIAGAAAAVASRRQHRDPQPVRARHLGVEAPRDPATR